MELYSHNKLKLIYKKVASNATEITIALAHSPISKEIHLPYEEFFKQYSPYEEPQVVNHTADMYLEKPTNDCAD